MQNISSDHNEIKREINNATSKVMYGSKGKSQVKKKLIEKNILCANSCMCKDNKPFAPAFKDNGLSYSFAKF